ncbi:MAG: Fic family protein [Clostridia bacterium]|nr:Fic family protein [Clostridia bacterium]
MGYSIDSFTDSCYEGTTCLINKFGITDEQKLAELEGRITFAKASVLERNPLEGNFDFSHYKAIHRFLFEDIYDWAGDVRKVNISKKGTVFVPADEIETIAEVCFGRLSDENLFLNLCRTKYIEQITDFYCVTNTLHPFREGNGRTQRIFISQLVRHAGYNIDFYNVDIDELMIATIQAANGIMDNLIKIFDRLITD